MPLRTVTSSPRAHIGRPMHPIALLRATLRQLIAIGRSRSASAKLDHANADRSPSPDASFGKRRVLVAGDSMALDWGAATAGHGLVGRLRRDHPAATIVRVARGHARMRDVAAQLRAALAALGSGPRYDVVLIIGGGNDALRWGGSGRLLRDAACIADLAQAVAHHAVWLGPANASLSPLFVAPFDRWMARRLQAVVEAIGVATRRRGIPFVDFFASRDEDVFSKDPQRFYAPDLLHPTDEAYGLCYRRVCATVPLKRWLASPKDDRCGAFSRRSPGRPAR